jgi:pyrroline-5-carboxylate reductase
MTLKNHTEAAADGPIGLKLCFCGAGSMAEAIVRGLLAAGLAQPADITMTNRANAARLAELHDRYGVSAADDEAKREQALREADVVFLCMKPKDAAEALRRLSPALRDGQLLVSVIAGLSIAAIEKLVGRRLPIARTMPNTSSTIGLGATGISFNDAATGAHRELVLKMFRAVGIARVVDEPLINAVTAVSGSGPAYLYYMMEAMIDAAKAFGLADDTARELTLQTVLGAAKMALETGEEPAELRRKVTSPGGTTQAAIETFEKLDFRGAVGQAMRRAAERAAEMGAELERSVTE